MSDKDSQTQGKVFDAETASSLVKELRKNFGSGRTRSYEWRVSQVKALLKAMVDNEDQIVDALRSDLAKPSLETLVYEVCLAPYSLAWRIFPSFSFLFHCKSNILLQHHSPDFRNNFVAIFIIILFFIMKYIFGPFCHYFNFLLL